MNIYAYRKKITDSITTNNNFIEIENGYSKNESLLVIITTLCINKEFHINNIPNISDTKILLDICKKIGSKINIKLQNDDFMNIIIETNVLDQKYIFSKDFLDDCSKIRASICFTGVFLCLIGKSPLILPGGCNFSARPINTHIQNFLKLGYILDENNILNIMYDIKSTSSNSDIQKDILLLDMQTEYGSTVTGSINVLLAALNHHLIIKYNKIILLNIAHEPECSKIYNLLKRINKNLNSNELEPDNLYIYSNPNVNNINESKINNEDNIIEYNISPDRIEAGTWIFISLILKQNLRLTNVNILDISSVIYIMEKYSICEYKINLSKDGISDNIEIINNNTNNKSEIKNILKEKKYIYTRAYPGFPTDLQSILTLFMSTEDILKNTKIILRDTIYPTRLEYIKYLSYMNLNVYTNNNDDICINRISLNNINDNIRNNKINRSKFYYNQYDCLDLRSGITILIAGIHLYNEIYLTNFNYIQRGYANIFSKLNKFGIILEEIKK